VSFITRGVDLRWIRVLDGADSSLEDLRGGNRRRFLRVRSAKTMRFSHTRRQLAARPKEKRNLGRRFRIHRVVIYAIPRSFTRNTLNYRCLSLWKAVSRAGGARINIRERASEARKMKSLASAARFISRPTPLLILYETQMHLVFSFNRMSRERERDSFEPSDSAVIREDNPEILLKLIRAMINSNTEALLISLAINSPSLSHFCGDQTIIISHRGR